MTAPGFRARLSLSLLLVIALGCRPAPTPATFTPQPTPEIPTAIPLSRKPSSLPPTTTPTELPLIRIVFTGDINPGRCPAQAERVANDFTLPYQAVAETLRAADIAIGSLDGTISDYS